MLTENEEQWHNGSIQFSNKACLDRIVMVQTGNVGFEPLSDLLLVYVTGHVLMWPEFVITLLQQAQAMMQRCTTMQCGVERAKG